MNITFQELLGEEEYKKVLDKVNADLPEAKKVLQLTLCIVHENIIVASSPYYIDFYGI